MALQPRVSVILPAYQASAFVRDAVASVLAQSYAHLELLVVPDDGETYQALRDEFPSSRLRVLPPETVASGCGPARNRGLDASTGEFFALCDADDLWPEHYLSTLMPLATHAGAACAVTRYTDWDAHPVRMPPAPPELLTVSGYAQQLSSLRLLLHRSLEPGYLNLFAEDVIHDLQVIAELGGQVPITDQTHYLLRERAGSQTNTGKAAEGAVHGSYTRHAHAARWRPSTLGLQRLTESDRATIAEAFEFRGYVSRAFEMSSVDSYNQFVAGRESSLWDSFNASRAQGSVPERRRAPTLSLASTS